MIQTFRRLVALTLFTLALSGAVFAQSFGYTVRANIPFNFYAGSKEMPAGDYTFAINRQNSVIAIYQRSTGNGALLLGSSQDGSKNGRTSLTFRANDENVYVLQKLQGPDVGLSFGTEKRMTHVAENGMSNATLTVLAELVK